MTNQQYFNDYADAEGSHYNFRGIFVKQNDLCEKYKQLQIGGINNLTLRLCLAQHEFCNLFKQTLGIRQKTRPDDYEFTYHMSGASTSGVATMLGVPNKEIGNPGEVVDLELHNVHQYFYSFCTFAVGVLDRLAVEMRECYGLTEIPERRIDWGYLFLRDMNISSERLAGKSINGILNDSRNSFDQLRDKRNTLEHRNFFEIRPGNDGKDFDYFIEGNIPLTNFAREQLCSILVLCNGVYEAIYEDANSVNFSFPILTSSKTP